MLCIILLGKFTREKYLNRGICAELCSLIFRKFRRIIRTPEDSGSALKFNGQSGFANDLA